MSSFIRRIEIRMMKSAKYTREKFIGVVNPITKERRIQEVPRGGEITDPDDNPIGRHWPKRIPARAKLPPNLKAKDLLARQSRHSVKIAFTPRASRRSKRSQKWLADRAAKRAQA